MQIDPLKPPIPRASDTEIIWEGLSGAQSSLAIANLSLAQEKPLLLITTSVHIAEKIYRELVFFLSNKNCPIYFFPDWETLPYDHFSPHEDIISERLLTLHKLPNLKNGIVIAALSTLMHRLAPESFIAAHSLLWSVNDNLNIDTLKNNLASAGYHHTEQVIQHGEFAIRGAIIDVFPMGSELPYRIELLDDVIETIRTFDPDSQKSIEKVQTTHLLPAHEFPLDEHGITTFRKNWRAKFSGNPSESIIYEHISKAKPVGGIEYYLSLFFDHTATIFDYMPKNMQCILHGNLPQKANQFFTDIKSRYEQLDVDSTRPLCLPSDIFISENELFSHLKHFTQIKISENQQTNLPNLSVDHKNINPLEHFENFIKLNDASTKILICAESTGRREVILELFNKNNSDIKIINSWDEFLKDNSNKINITICAIENALWLQSEKIILITETQLFGEPLTQLARHLKKRVQDPDTIIKSLAELQIGALIVHLDHGIGKYEGLERITTDDIEAEYLTLTYAGGDRIYVPIGSLHLISRYTGGNTDTVALNKLGTGQWEKAKQKAAQKIRDVAAELLKIYAEREAVLGFEFPKPSSDYLLFRDAFPFEETVDQRQAIDAVISDMCSTKCMDRLVCGDVGFGKTEVAMQAAFLAAHAGKQVAILVPTTLLANQHYENFQNRFSDWPIKIGILSRLQSDKNQKNVIDQLQSGKLDIVIGTHKLLNENIIFKDLGLLIIDEEHRFGVRQKDRIKAMRAQVDILTLTATPIPRTLNMSMAGIRDLSIIATPPAKRLSIKTFCHEFNDGLIKEAIVRETMRGGQVYFLHNDIDTIAGVVEKLKQQMPDVKIAFGHGQMPEHQLERVMADFYHQRFDVLVCTTIIESGIDIPTANTIIINNANRFGLAQLHQIRGRVGRSHHQAYAYLLVHNKKALTLDAKKRLDALTELEALGVGFQLATHDLEIRGAGELLGESQSGHIEAIGFSLYMELLDETVKALKAGKKPPEFSTHQKQTEIDLKIAALFPENYMHDVHIRLVIYKRLSECPSGDEIQNLKSEIIDRFGLLPEAAQNLFAIAHLKIICKAMGIFKIDTQKSFGYLHFIEKPNVDPKLIIQLIQNQYKVYQLVNANTLRFTLPEAPEARLNTVSNLLGKLKS